MKDYKEFKAISRLVDRILTSENLDEKATGLCNLIRLTSNPKHLKQHVAALHAIIGAGQVLAKNKGKTESYLMLVNSTLETLFKEKKAKNQDLSDEGNTEARND